MTTPSPGESPLAHLELGLERDIFLRTLIRHLAGTLEDVVGLEEASGFISVVGLRMGEELNADYRRALALPQLSREQVAQVLVDLKARIHGDFTVLEQDDEKIILANRRCPFGELIEGRPSICMMTSNVFGTITAENLGYAKVSLEQTIAEGHPGCRVVVYLKPTTTARNAPGREYVRT